MRIGSQPLFVDQKPGDKKASAAAAPQTGSAGVARDALALSGGSVKDGLRSLKQSITHLFDMLLGRQKEKPKAEVPVAPPAPLPVPAPAPKQPTAGPTLPPAPEVRQQAEQVWYKPHTIKSSFRNGVQDAHDVNEQSAERDEQAAALVAANATMEQERLTALTPTQREQYAGLQQVLQDRPQARLALQVLLADGKLTAKPHAKGGGDLLAKAHGLITQPLAPGVDRTTFLGELLHEIAVPSAINQHDKATCTVTSVQILTAMHNPAEYARIVGGLASPEGTVALANGRPLVREPGTETDDGSKRTDASRLWQAAFMQLAVGPGVDYDNAQDTRNDGKWGIFGPELDRVVDALTNRDTPLLSTSDTYSGADLVRDITPHLNAGHPVPVCMEWGEKSANGDEHSGHDILVTAIKDGQVHYNNPWGYQETMSLPEFTQRVWWANPIDMTKKL
jgi:hypothetical protein